MGETNAFTELLGLDAYGLEVTIVVRDGRILEEVAHGVAAAFRFDGEAARALLELIHAWRLAAPESNG